MSTPRFAFACAAILFAIVPLVRAAEPAPVPVADLKGNLNAARFTPDGKTLIVAGVRGLFVVDPATAKVTREIETKSSLDSLAISPDGTLAAAAVSDGSIAIYVLADGSVRLSIPAAEFKAKSFLGPALAGFTPDGKSLVGGGKGAGVWNVADGKLLRSIAFARTQDLLVLSPDGKSLLTVSRDGGIPSLYDVATGALAAHQPELKKSSPQEFNPNPAMVNDLGFFPDGKRFYAGGFMSTGLYIYTVADGSQSGRLKLEGYQAGHFSKDMSKLVWGSWNTQPNAKNAITISDAKSGALLKQFPSAMTIFSTLSPDGNTLFVLPQGGDKAMLYSFKAASK